MFDLMQLLTEDSWRSRLNIRMQSRVPHIFDGVPKMFLRWRKLFYAGYPWNT